MSYWKNGPSESSRPIEQQLRRWKTFRRFQARNRKYFVPLNRFQEFQQKVLERRQRHGFEGDFRLLEDRDNQGDLEHWIEYQDFELRTREDLQNKLKEAKAGLIALRKEVAEAGLSAFEGIEELEFGKYYAMVVESEPVEKQVRDQRSLAERNLDLAKSRLEGTHYDRIGDTVDKAVWIQSFQQQVEAAQRRLDAVPRYLEEDWEPGGRFYIEEGRDNRVGESKMREARGKRCNDWLGARKALKLAKAGLEAAQSDAFSNTIERAVLVDIVQEKIRAAEVALDEANRASEKFELKARLLGALSAAPNLRRKLQEHQIVLTWTEQQRCEMASGSLNERDSDMTAPKQAILESAQARRSTRVTQSKSPTKLGRPKGKQSCGTVLSPVHQSKINKVKSKRRSPCRKSAAPHSPHEEEYTVTSDHGTTKSRGKHRLSSIENSPLHVVRSARVVKSSVPKSPRRGKEKAAALARSEAVQSSAMPSTRGAPGQSATVGSRRSTRIARQPERFCPG